MRSASIALVLLLAGALLSLLVGPLHLAQLDGQLWGLRLTRLAAGVLAGAALSVAGVLMQGLFRNPLASPSVCGVSEGAGLAMQMLAMAAAMAPILPGAAVLVARPLAGLLGAGAALLVLLFTARRREDTASVLLVGLVLSLLFSSLAACLLALGNDRWELGRALVALSLGGIDGAAPAGVALITPLVLAGLIAAWHWAPDLDLLLSGEEEAAALGVEVARLRLWTLVWAAALTAAAVAIGGGVAFVGLVVPNLVRMCEGPLHRRLILGSAIGGAAFVTLADVASRLLHPGPGELPLGVVTSLIGAPVFLILLQRESRAGRW